MFGTSNVPVATVDIAITFANWHMGIEAFHTNCFLVCQWKIHTSDCEDVGGCTILSFCTAAMGWMHV